MRFTDIIKISFSNLFRQKLRTLLTIFSIVIGTTLISLVYSIIPGFENFFNLQFNSLNSPRLIEIYPSRERHGGEMLGMFGKDPEEYQEGEDGSFDLSFEGFKDEDIRKVSEIEGVVKVHETTLPSVEYISLIGDEKKFKTSFVAYYPSFLLENFGVVSGRKLQDDDKGKVLIANQFVNAFGYEDPNDLIGKEIILHVKQSKPVDTSFGLAPISSEQADPQERDFEFEVVGITEKTILSTVIFIPFEDALEMTKFGGGTEEVLTDKDERRFAALVELESADVAEEVDRKIEELGFRGMTFEESKNILNDIFNVLMIVFSSFGVIALAVSSLNIINTLIMAVYERTREIGVMKAVGATGMNVAILFTIEAALIGLFGGIVGLGIGFGLSEILNIWGHRTILSAFETLDLSNITPLLFLAPGMSTVVATIAGIYPAIRASRLNPVEALRYE